MRYFVIQLTIQILLQKKPDKGGIPAIENKIKVKDNASKGFTLDKLTTSDK